FRGIGPWEHYIFPYTSLEQKFILQDHPKMPAITLQVHLGKVLAIYGNGSGHGVEETGRQSGDGRFSRTGTAYKGDYLARSDIKINIVEYFLILFIGKGNVLKGDIPFNIV